MSSVKAGDRFGYLTAKERLENPVRNKRICKKWVLECVCGNFVYLRESDFNRKTGQKSCGCMNKVHSHRKDLAGQRFGMLTAVRIIAGEKIHNCPVWLFECDCGNTRKMTARHAIGHQKRLNETGKGKQLSCGDPKHEPLNHYPPAPIPYPTEAAKIYEKYLHLVHRGIGNKVDAEVVDERNKRLLRACWLLVLKQQQGKTISKVYERCYVRKWLSYTEREVRKRRIRVGCADRVLQSHSGDRYNESVKNALGNTRSNQKAREKVYKVVMNLTSNTEAVLQTQPDFIHSGDTKACTRPKKIRFKRC